MAPCGDHSTTGRQKQKRQGSEVNTDCRPERTCRGPLNRRECSPRLQLQYSSARWNGYRKARRGKDIGMQYNVSLKTFEAVLLRTVYYGAMIPAPAWCRYCSSGCYNSIKEEGRRGKKRGHKKKGGKKKVEHLALPYVWAVSATASTAIIARVVRSHPNTPSTIFHLKRCRG